MQEDNIYVAYEQEEQFWAANEQVLKEEHPNQFLIISRDRVIVAVDDYFSAEKILSGWPEIAIIQYTGDYQPVVNMPHIQAGRLA